MKKVGRQVLFLETNENNLRNGEGSFVRLSDGRIMYAYTQFLGKSREDHATAQIVAIYSSDEGETWTEPTVLFDKGPNSLNVMGASILKLANGEIGIKYGRKDMTASGYIVAMPKYRYSKDDGKTWSEEIACAEEPGYYCGTNNRLVQLKNGRLLYPYSYLGGEKDRTFTAGVFKLFYSDDNGRTWGILDTEVRSPFNDNIGLQEPGILELDDGRIWMYCRTEYGHQYQSFSSDGGMTWTTPAPNFLFTSPNSPMLATKVKDYVIAIYNPLGYSPVNDRVWHSETANGRPIRTPFICAFSRDGGKSFDTTNKTFRPSFVNECVYLEDDLNNGYCYPAVIEVEGGFLVAYYHSNGSDVNCLNCTKMIKISWEEVENAIKF